MHVLVINTSHNFMLLPLYKSLSSGGKRDTIRPGKYSVNMASQKSDSCERLLKKIKQLSHDGLVPNLMVKHQGLRVRLWGEILPLRSEADFSHLVPYPFVSFFPPFTSLCHFLLAGT